MKALKLEINETETKLCQTVDAHIGNGTISDYAF